MLPLLILAACTGKGGPATGADTGAADLAPLPAVAGIAPAEDHDPAEDVVEVHLTASVDEVTWVDGTTTEVWTYNGQVPGPLIQARVGDTVRVVLDNQLDDETTIHWHGLRIPDEMDGVPAIQDPVPPGGSFTYEFVVPDAGTFWYHPHVRSNEQIEHGLQGMLVVHEREPVPGDGELGFVIDDVYLEDDGSFGTFLESHPEQMHGRHGNMLLTNGSPEALEGTVRPLGNERWRIVNTANARTMWVDVTGASWRVVGVDGGLLPEPYEAERVQLPVGRRFDLEVIPDADATDVQLRVLLPAGSGEWYDYPVFQAAVEGEPGDGEWLDRGATPLPELLDARQEVELKLKNRADGMDIAWTINGATYGEHEAIEVLANTPTLVTIEEWSGAEHPFHLHGQFFQVVSRDGEQLPEDAGLLDTVLVDGREDLVLYTTFDNPGRWMAHCHILEHAELGMMTELVVSEQ